MRRLWALIHTLPPESATSRNGDWTMEEELAVQTTEWLEVLAKLAAGEKATFPGGVRYQRPESANQKRVNVVSGREFASLIGKPEGGEQ